MTRKKKTALPKADRRRDDPAQSRVFIKKAREVEADETNSEAEAVLGVLAKKPPTRHKAG
jgi:hypothetical protein